MQHHQNMTQHQKRESRKHSVTKDQMKVVPSVTYHVEEEETLNMLQPTVYPKIPRCPQNMESHAMSSNYQVIRRENMKFGIVKYWIHNMPCVIYQIEAMNKEIKMA